MAKTDLTAERLRELLHYDPETGIFTWLVHRPPIKAGAIAGGFVHSYLRIRISGRAYGSHRLAWLYMTGEWPEEDIDHINGVKHDNRIKNLRNVSRLMNTQNQRRAQSHNTSGLLGVSRVESRNKWVATIKFAGKKRHIGYFRTPQEAHDAYIAAKRQLHEGCTI